MAQPLPLQFNNQLYAIVVRGDNLVLPTLYIPRIVDTNAQGKPLFTKSGQPMLKVNLDYATTSYNRKTVKFQSVMQDRNRLDEVTIKACDSLKKFLNGNLCMLWFHREERDAGCSEGNHLHIMFWNKGSTTALAQQKPFRTLRQKVNAIPGAHIQQMRVKNTGMFIYLNSGNAIAKMTQTENSRIFMGSTSTDLLRFNAAFHPSELKQVYHQYKKCWVTNGKDDDDDSIYVSDVSSNQIYGVFGMNPPVPKKVHVEDGTVTVVQEQKSHSNIPGLIDPKIPTPAQLNSQLKRKRMDEFGHIEFNEDDEMLSVALMGSVSKKSKIDERVEGMVRLYTEFKNQNFKRLMRAVVLDGNPDNITIIREVNRSSNRLHIIHAAMTEFSLLHIGNQNPEPVMSLYLKGGYMVNKFDSIGVFETLNLLNTWCQHYGESLFLFLAHCYLILAKKLNKRNCLPLEGVSNAGKTFWMECMLKPINDFVGRILSNEDKFRYGYLQGMAVARCEELGLLTKATVDDFKQIAGGQTFQANVKHNAPVMVDRIPMIVTTNHPLWRLIPADKDAILNRCIMYKFNKSAPCLVERGKGAKEPNSDLFRYCFEFFEEEGLTCKEEEGDLQISFRNSYLNEKNVMSFFASWMNEQLILEDDEFVSNNSDFRRKWNAKEEEEYELFKNDN